MREAGHTSPPAPRLRLLAWLCCHGLALTAGASSSVDRPGIVGMGCQSEYITVAETTSFPIGGCYQKTDNYNNEDRDTLYINRGGVEGSTKQIMIARDLDVNRERWAIAEVGVSATGSHFSKVMCRGAGDWEEAKTSPALVQLWECVDKATVEELVTCGCAASDLEGFIHPKAEGTEAAAVAGVEAAAGGIRSNIQRGRIRGVGSRSNGAFAGPRGGAVVSRSLESVGGFHGFWIWVIIAGGIAGLIVLCCVGWYIRNPFFCQKPPPANPDIQIEDAAPQAPKTSFQPWGASAPPK